MKNIYIDTMDDAMEVIKWFNNHTYALGLFQKEQLMRNNKVLALILGNLTRWSTHYVSGNRLVELKKPMQTCILNHESELLSAAGSKPEQKQVAQGIIDTVQKTAFWEILAK
jgi:hypothetical protein